MSSQRRVSKVIKETEKFVTKPVEKVVTSFGEVEEEADESKIKELFELANTSHYNSLLDVAINYLAMSSAMSRVVSDLKQIAASDMSFEEDTFRNNLDKSSNVAIAHYIMNCMLKSVGASDEVVQSTFAAYLESKDSPLKVKTLSPTEVISAVSSMVKNTPVGEGPYGDLSKGRSPVSTSRKGLAT